MSTNPLSAIIFALKTLGVSRLGLVTPYRDDLNVQMRNCFAEAQIHVTAIASFNVEDDNIGRKYRKNNNSEYSRYSLNHYLEKY